MVSVEELNQPGLAGVALEFRSSTSEAPSCIDDFDERDNWSHSRHEFAVLGWSLAFDPGEWNRAQVRAKPVEFIGKVHGTGCIKPIAGYLP